MNTYTLIHVGISMVGILTGLIVLGGLLAGESLAGWTALFLATTIATSATGFGFKFEKVLPSHIVGGISLVLLGVAIYARYARGLGGIWRKIYVVTAMTALYLNVFVFITQAFQKVKLLNDWAPKQSSPGFKMTQLAVLCAFAVMTLMATIRFRGGLPRSA